MPHPDELQGRVIGSPRWYTPTLLNGWVNFGAGYNDAGFSKNLDGTVRLRGLLKSGVVGSSMFTLPAGCRPEKICLFGVLVSGLVFGAIEVRPNGDVVPTNGNNTYMLLDNISFQAI